MKAAIKNKLDRVFSQYIRLRDSNDMGNFNCISCGRLVHWKKGHCGHFEVRGKMSTRWHEQNCNGQCVKCNTFNEGNKWGYGKGLEEKYGEGTADKLLVLSNQTKKWSNWEGEELIKHYTKEVKKFKDAIRA